MPNPDPDPGTESESESKSKFHAFDVSDVAYKVVDGHKVEATVCVPKDARPGDRLPVMVRFHGGALVNGARAYTPWLGTWTLTLASSHSAIFITPDYRLLPSATGTEILADIADFWSWLHSPSGLNAYLAGRGKEGVGKDVEGGMQGVVADLGNVLVTGESAGGWCAVQSVLVPTLQRQTLGQGGERHPYPPPRAVIAHYPMLDMASLSGYTWAGPSSHLDAPVLSTAEANGLLDAVLEAECGKVVTERIPEGGEDWFMAMVQTGRYGEVLGKEEELYPLVTLERLAAGRWEGDVIVGAERGEVAGAEGKGRGAGEGEGTEGEMSRESEKESWMVPIWVFHGTADPVIPARGTETFVAKVRQLFPAWPLHVHYEADAAHGFDGEATHETPWVKEGVAWIEKYWP